MTRRTAATVCCIAAALALGGCSSEEPPPVSSTPEPQITSVQSTTSIPTPTQEADAGCPNEAAAASNRGLQRGPSLRA
ncbi:MAG TPA: hypothetical protein VFK89_06715, partial [Actinomycetota bacterium]|nr:hypothetical protein [Actinomycetota bacterium]